MSQISAIMLDSREPDSIKNLKFGGLPVMVTMLDTADIQAVTDDGHTLLIERKTTDDFLNTLKDDRLFMQMAKMTEISNAQLRAGEPVTHWAYLLIEEPFTGSRDGKVITSRGVTGWSWAALQGTLLSIQELGVNIVFANGAMDFENTVLSIGRRSRKPEIRVIPPRPANVLGPKATFLASLPGIGIERVQEILDWSNNNVGHALIGLTDMEIKSPVGLSVRRRIRNLFSLNDGENIELTGTQMNQPILQGEK